MECEVNPFLRNPLKEIEVLLHLPGENTLLKKVEQFSPQTSFPNYFLLKKRVVIVLFKKLELELIGHNIFFTTSDLQQTLKLTTKNLCP